MAGILLWGLQGCRGAWPPLLPPAHLLTSAEQILEILEQRQGAFRNLRASATVVLTSPGSRSRARQIVLLDGRRHLRFDAFGPFGQPLMSLTSNGEELLVFYPAQRRLVRARPTARALGRLTGMSFSLEEISTLLAGNLPRASDGIPKGFAYLSSEQAYWLELWSPSLETRQRLWVDASQLVPLRGEYRDRGGQVVWQATLGGHVMHSGYPFPQMVTIELPPQGVSLQIRYHDIILNQGVRADLFSLILPGEGVEVVELDGQE